MCFIDLQKAYASVDRELLWELLARFGLPETVLSNRPPVLRRLLVRVCTDGGEHSIRLDTTRGLRQWRVLSPLLFSTFFAAAMCVVLVCFGDDKDKRNLVYYDETGMSGDEKPFARTRRAVWRRLYAVDAGIVSKSPQGFTRMIKLLLPSSKQQALPFRKRRRRTCLSNDRGQVVPGARGSSRTVHVQVARAGGQEELGTPRFGDASCSRHTACAGETAVEEREQEGGGRHGSMSPGRLAGRTGLRNCNLLRLPRIRFFFVLVGSSFPVRGACPSFFFSVISFYLVVVLPVSSLSLEGYATADTAIFCFIFNSVSLPGYQFPTSLRSFSLIFLSFIFPFVFSPLFLVLFSLNFSSFFYVCVFMPWKLCVVLARLCVYLTIHSGRNNNQNACRKDMFMMDCGRKLAPRKYQEPLRRVLGKQPVRHMNIHV